MSLEKIRMAIQEAGSTRINCISRGILQGCEGKGCTGYSRRVWYKEPDPVAGFPGGLLPMSRFLSVVSVPEAVATAIRIAPDPVSEETAADRATGRAICADVIAGEDIPGFDRSVVDGFAVRAKDTAGSSEAIPALLRCAGRVAMGYADAALSVTAGEWRVHPDRRCPPGGSRCCCHDGVY